MNNRTMNTTSVPNRITVTLKTFFPFKFNSVHLFLVSALFPPNFLSTFFEYIAIPIETIPAPMTGMGFPQQI